MRSYEEMLEVRRLLVAGVPPPSIARELDIPVQTVGRWSRGETLTFGQSPPIPPWRPPDDWSYAYLLGIYLGDGTISVTKSGKCFLRICLDGAYPEIVEEVRDAIGITTLGGRTQVLSTPGSCVSTVQSAWKRWPEAFPQHGPARKHERAIVLEDWQKAIVDAHHSADIRALFCDACDALGVRWTLSNPRNVSVSHRESVAILEEVVGPKR